MKEKDGKIAMTHTPPKISWLEPPQKRRDGPMEDDLPFQRDYFSCSSG